jgi:hypothetical protein
MITIAVYQHKVLPTRALVTATRGPWVEFYLQDHKNLSYLEESVFEQSYQMFMSIADRPLYTEPELVELRKQVRAEGILVPTEFD